MKAPRVLLVFQLLLCLMATISGCQTSRSCQPFIGLNNCYNSGGKEPRLPPRDNTCCGPHCVYTPPNTQRCGPCDGAARTRCLLDTHCGSGMAFTFVRLSDCDLSKRNADRLKAGFARLLSFPWDQKKCLGMNTKCGINCCCRENCPKQFCKF
ncbi:uncharacterized protein LOC108027746 [Drosophila biarmipes]|uniref:uncharacterized protein LOC108027746 n=1 Tax=Drosophila biarmipes TaxID=125945 RepID=UPI0007E76B7E|nr:uncharacterized protein LOC108027746 [Drosophila biarmipes]